MGDWVKLEVVQPKSKYVFISPYDQRIQVPSFENRPDNVVEIVLAQPGDQALLQNGQALVAITARIINELDTSSKKESNREDALTRVARSFGLKGEEVNEAIRVWKNRAQEPREQALIALYESKYSDASRLFAVSLENDERELKKSQEHVFRDARFLGISAFREKNFSAAERAFRRAAEIKPTDNDAYVWLARCFFELKRYDEAEDTYRRALSLTNDEYGKAEIILSFVDVLEVRGKFGDEEKLLIEAYKINYEIGEPQSYAEYLEALAAFLERRGRYDEAADQYRELFMAWYHPREFPSLDTDSLLAIVRIRKEQKTNFVATDICRFVTKDYPEDDTCHDQNSELIGAIRQAQRVAAKQP
jgi:Flp pilus assembly protein TadD